MWKNDRQCIKKEDNCVIFKYVLGAIAKCDHRSNHNELAQEHTNLVSKKF
jgi:hypothetical protein